MSSIVLALIAMAVFPIDSWLLQPLEKRFMANPDLPESIEGIIVLSGALNPSHSMQWDQTEVNGAADRELAFMRLARLYPDARLVYTGGSSSLLDSGARAADIALKLFGGQGMDTSRITFERDARNTYENATLSYDLVNPALDRPWILITSAYHMPRSIGIFCQVGWPMIPFPVDHRTLPEQSLSVGFNLGGHLSGLDIAIHEWLGLLAYRITGKTTALLPRQCSA